MSTERTYGGLTAAELRARARGSRHSGVMLPLPALTDLLDEVERLRGALETVCDKFTEFAYWEVGGYDEPEAVTIARRALEEPRDD